MIQEAKLLALKDAFIERGGSIIRRAVSKTGEPIIEHRNKLTNNKWKTRLTYTSETLRDKSFEFLTRKQKQFFKAE